LIDGLQRKKKRQQNRLKEPIMTKIHQKKKKLETDTVDLKTRDLKTQKMREW
jgi:hypothetical protein